MKIKIYVIFIMILFPVIVVGQNRDTCLTPMADVIFKKGIIYYVIHNDADVQLEPLIFPQTYQIAHNTSSTLCQVHFTNKSDLLDYLNNVKAVFIDHLHFLVDLARIGNSSLEIGSIVRNIKKVALRQDVVVFLIAHTKKIKSGFEELSLGDVRDSSFIEQEADTVLYIWRKEENEVDVNRSILKIAKNRKLGTKDKKILLKYVDGDLMELANDEI